MSTIEEYILQTDAKKAGIVSFLRQLIFSCSPFIKEEMNLGVPHYFYKQDGLCYIKADREKVTLAFCNGEEISDPFSILQNSGQSHVKILTFNTIKEIDYDKVIPLLQQALLINELHYCVLPHAQKQQITENQPVEQ